MEKMTWKEFLSTCSLEGKEFDLDKLNVIGETEDGYIVRLLLSDVLDKLANIKNISPLIEYYQSNKNSFDIFDKLTLLKDIGQVIVYYWISKDNYIPIIYRIVNDICQVVEIENPKDIPDIYMKVSKVNGKCYCEGPIYFDLK